MNLDQLRHEWAERDRILAKSISLNTRLLRENFLEKNLSHLRKLNGGFIELVLSVPCILLLGSFNAAHWLDWKFFVSGVLLQAWITIMLAVGIAQRRALQNLDYSQPLLTLQRDIEILKMRRMVTLKWAFLTGQVVWFVPFLLVLFKGIFGVNLYAKSDWLQTFSIISIAVGTAIIPIAIWASTAFGKRWGQSVWFQQFTDNLAGRDLMAAKAFLEKLRKFENT